MSLPLPADHSIHTSNPKRAFDLLRGDDRHVGAEAAFADEEDAVPADSFRVFTSEVESSVVDSSVVDSSVVESPTQTIDESIRDAIADSLQQTQELVGLLSQREQTLTERDVEFQVKTWNWQQETKKVESRLANRAAKIDERETQLMALQFELFQLQHQLIDSQLATREVVENMALGSANPHAIATLKSLQFEMGQRFDHVHQKWSELVNRLESIAAEIAEKMAHDRSA